LHNVVERALQKDSAARYQSAYEMRRALLSSIQSLKTVDTIEFATERSTFPVRSSLSYVNVARRRPILLLVAVLIFVGSISVAGRLVMRSRFESQAPGVTPLATLGA